MKKIIILLLCCGMLVSMVGCGGNTASPPTGSSSTTVSGTTITETTLSVVKIEPAEKEKEPPHDREQGSGNGTGCERHKAYDSDTAKEKIKPTETAKPIESLVVENTVLEEGTPPENEEQQEEIYQGIQWPEVNPADIERVVIEKINAYRIAQGDTAATMLPGLTEVARYRANELTINFAHTDIRDVCKKLKYGEFVDMTLYDMTAENSYYQGYSREAIGMGEWFGTAESMSDRIADGFHHSKGHWSYVGSSKYPYIAVGVSKANDKWYVCICMSKENYGG